MLINLVKKDVLISRKYAALVTAVMLFVPMLISYKQPQMRGSISLLLTTTMAAVIFQLALSEAEIKYPKATVFLCATPYTRKKIVASKYLLHTLIFLCCCIVYVIESMLISFVSIISLTEMLKCYLGFVLAMGIYIPISFKFGYEKTKFFLIIFYFLLMIIISVFSDLTPQITEKLLAINFYSKAVTDIPFMRDFVLLVAAIGLWLLSMVISFGLYSNKDLG